MSDKKIIRPLWIEIDLAALRKNYKAIKRHVGDNVKIVATVKQEAYGHGLIPVANELLKVGVDYFGVASVEEAQSLRKAGIKIPILILGAVGREFADYFVKYKLTATVVDLNFAKALNKAAIKRGVKAKAHIKIDTGMGRLGLHHSEAGSFIKELKKLDNIILEGLYTHFPCADEDPDFTNYQIDLFNRFIDKMKRDGIAFKYYHCANSLGVVDYINSHFNMVRPGLILYGVNPNGFTNVKVDPILSLKSKIVFLKDVVKGATISYGRTFTATKKSLIGVVAVGYADGYPWALSNIAKVIVKDKLCNVAGRVCMDFIMVDLTDNSNVKIGDEVTLIGKKGKLEILSTDLAKLANTIAYEIVSGLSLKIPRIYKNKG